MVRSTKVKDLFRAMQRGPRYAFAKGDRGQAENLMFIEAQLAEIRPGLPCTTGSRRRHHLRIPVSRGGGVRREIVKQHTGRGSRDLTAGQQGSDRALNPPPRA